MFHKLVGLVVAAVVAMTGLSFAGTTSASAAGGDQSSPQVVYLNKIKPEANKACKPGYDKMFRVNLRVQKGERIKSFGAFSLRVNGRDRYDSGSRVNKRLVEFYYSVGRKAKVARDLAKSYGYVEVTSGATPRAVVERLCFHRGT